LLICTSPKIIALIMSIGKVNCDSMLRSLTVCSSGISCFKMVCNEYNKINENINFKNQYKVFEKNAPPIKIVQEHTNKIRSE